MVWHRLLAKMDQTFLKTCRRDTAGWYDRPRLRKRGTLNGSPARLGTVLRCDYAPRWIGKLLALF